MHSQAKDGRCTTAVGSLQATLTPQRDAQYNSWGNEAQTSPSSEGIPLTTRSLVNYLDLSGSVAFGLFFCVIWVLSRFLDEGQWLVHDWGVVHMCGQRAGGAGCGTPAGRGALWAVEGSWCCPLGHLATAPAQHSFSPWKSCHNVTSPSQKSFLCTIFLSRYVCMVGNQPLLQGQASLVAALALDWVHCWRSHTVICDVSVSVFTPQMGLTWWKELHFYWTFI